MLKVFTIFKKGRQDDPSNYRGISVLSAIPKLYDMILSNRFSLWYKPRPEQAGAQPGRSCEEQILCVRLLIDIARKCGYTLYIVFIDYQKAYDRVNRLKLIEYLDSKGCGNTFLKALQHAMISSGIIGDKLFTTGAGVKQGGSTSCNSFTSYIDPTIDAVKTSEPDGWLEDIHILLLMDDTVILASSRESMEAKLAKLKASVDDIGMLLHPSKCQYLTVNSDDTTPFVLGDAVISKTASYIYLGALISNDKISSQVKNHLDGKAPHLRKFTSFLTKNSDCPYNVKFKVWSSALNAAVLYSCETWIANELKPAEKPYLGSLKQMLGVRNTTCGDLVHIETGLPDVKSLIVDRQVKFLEKLGSQHVDDYVSKIINMAHRVRSPMGRRIQYLNTLQNTPSQSAQFMTRVKSVVQQSDSSRRQGYLYMNPNLEIHPATDSRNPLNIPEQYRIALTRIRLSSHHLRIETGRWSRIPRENRLCQCRTDIQTEEHVLLRCAISGTLRDHMNTNAQTLHELFDHIKMNQPHVAEYCYLIMNLYRTLP